MNILVAGAQLFATRRRVCRRRPAFVPMPTAPSFSQPEGAPMAAGTSFADDSAAPSRREPYVGRHRANTHPLAGNHTGGPVALGRGDFPREPFGPQAFLLALDRANDLNARARRE